MKLFSRRRNSDAEQVEQVELDLRGDEPVIRLGYPSDCPQCGHRGFLDHVDIRNRSQTEHCTACGHRWNETADMQ